MTRTSLLTFVPPCLRASVPSLPLRAFGPACLLLSLPGCLERTITITSEPPGALVTVSDTEIGRTPVTTSFEHFGRYDVQVRKEGHVAASEIKKVRAPLYEVPPIDLASMALPITLHTSRAWHFTLPPDQADTREGEAALLNRARAFAAQAQPAKDAQPPSQ